MSWKEVRFGDLYSEPSRNGLTRPRSSRGSGFKMINMGEIFGHDRIGCIPMERVQLSPAEIERFSVRTLDLVFARQSMVAEGAGKCSLVTAVDEVTCFESHLIRVRLDQRRADPAFFYLYFKAPLGRSKIEAIVTGAAQKGIRGSELQELTVDCPPLESQRRIASILSAYDDLIENNTRRIAILEEIARRIYEEWFVRFRFPGHEQVKMVESELGLIPEGWELRRLGDVVELAYGKALKAEERKPGPYPVYGSSGVVGSHDTSLVNGPGIIVGRKGNVGSVHWCDVSFYPIDTVYFVRTELPLHYVFFNLKRQNFINNDAAVPGLNRNQAYSLHFLVPSKVVLGRFVELCGPIFKQLRLLAVKNANLRATRDLLLPKLISGELDVSKLPEPTV